MKSGSLLITFCIVLTFLFISCINNTKISQDEIETSNGLFNLLDPESSGLNFTNYLDEDKLTNPYNYINLYLGGGVAIGDINNDGLQDVFLSSNMGTSKLFLNKGNMKFEDITEESGVSTEGWCTAVTMADINNDGFLDIYVCKSYHDYDEYRKNLCFLNNGDNTFTESGKLLGIDDENYSIASSFFDYDRDGDLDLIVGNHPRYLFIPLNIHYDYWKNPIKKYSNRLFRNDGNKFTDVTQSAGILSYGHTLAISTSDFNVDGYPDIFITVDHSEPDYIFQNNGDGTFKNVVNEVVNQTSKSSMGIDAGDINHDIYPDYFVSEMLSENHFREKVHMDMTNIDRFALLVDTMGYKYYQMHNFLYLNNGNNSLSDISQMAGVHKSDWSWSNLLMDFDNDSWQDLFISNGYYKHIFQKDMKNELDKQMESLGDLNMNAKNNLAKEFVKKLGVDKIPNYLFKNNGNLTFDNYSYAGGLSKPTISTGAAYGDLDNDGDLDLVINNIGEASMLYENKSRGNNYLRVKAENSEKNNALGSRVYITEGDNLQSRELLTTRGFQSSSEPIAHFGLRKVSIVDKLEFIWSDGNSEILYNVEANQTIVFKYENSSPKTDDLNKTPDQSIANVFKADELGINYFHHENEFNDYNIQILLPHKMSEYGPHQVVGDLNSDGLDDIYFPNPHQQMSRLFLQNGDNTFSEKRQKVFFEDRNYEDGKCALIDIDNDNDLDLIVSSTGYEFEEDNKLYKPRLYLNDGNANFKRSEAFDEYAHSSSVVELGDVDNDGDLDIFVGGRLKPHTYPMPGTSALFINNGKLKFENKIKEIAPDLENSGMVNDAVWTDLDNDSDLDLIVVGEWMPISIWINDSGKLVEQTKNYFDTPLVGWWNTIKKTDLDNDGIDEYVVGNLGLNYKYKATQEKPFVIYSKDFDQNGSYDIVLGTYYGENLFPVRGKTCSTQQLPEFENIYKTYSKYASLELNDLYGDRLIGALKYEANEFASLILKLENGKFTVKMLPIEVQVSAINGIVDLDINNDGLKDLIVAGNLYQSEIETGRAGSGIGKILLNNGNLNFIAMDANESGVYLPDDVKSLNYIEIGGSRALIAGINNSSPKIVIFNDLEF